MTQPELDEQLVQHLAQIADRLDGGDENVDLPLLEEFNRVAGTEIPFSEFQGICGGEDHITYVRRVLAERATNADPRLDRDGLIEMFTKALADPCDDAYLKYVFATIEKTFGDSQVSDLVFWPGEYFGDANNQRELKPDEMADAVLDRYARLKKR